MKKIFVLFLALIMALSCVGCGGDNANDGEVPTLVWHLPGSKQADMALVMEEVNKIVEPAIGAKIDIQFIDDAAYNEKMNMYIASGKEFDLCFTGYTNNYANCVMQGGIIPLKELVETEAPALKTAIPQFLLDAVNIDGDYYAIPNVQAIAMPTALYLRKDLIEKYNFDVATIKTADDIEPMLETIKQNETDIYPIDIGGTMTGLWKDAVIERVAPGFEELVIRKDDPTCKVYRRTEIPEYQHGIKKLREWYQKGYIPADVSSAAADASAVYFAKAGSWKPGGEIDMGIRDKCEYEVVLLSEPYIFPDLCTQTMTGISATSKHPEKAIKFLELVHTNEEVYHLICHGIEGKHYEKIDDLHIKKIENSEYDPNRDWALGNQFNAYLLEGKADDLWTETEKLNNNAKTSPLLGFTFDKNNVLNEVTQCATVESEYKALNQGSVDVDSFLEKYNKSMNEAGIETIRAEMQKQIDKFLASKK